MKDTSNSTPTDSLVAAPSVIVVVNGGVVQEILAPAGTTALLIDYDEETPEQIYRLFPCDNREDLAAEVIERMPHDLRLAFRREIFRRVYEEELRQAISKQPDNYRWAKSEERIVDFVTRMTDAVCGQEQFSFVGDAMLSTLRRLGVRRTYKAVAQYMHGGS